MELGTVDPENTPMSWIRNSTEPTERRPIDMGRLVFCALSVVVLGVWAQSQSAIDVNFFLPINDLSNNILGLAKAVYALGSIWAVVVIALVLLALRQVPVALRVAIWRGWPHGASPS